MKISFSWLKEYIDISLSPEVLGEKLTMVGLEVENIERLGSKYDGFVVGEVIDMQKHPKADKLSICKVNTGNEVIQIVCGAPNVSAGQKVPVGLVGAIVPRNQHDPDGKPFTLTHVKLRGEDSYGMICSSYELDLGEDHDGIMVLDSKAKAGDSLSGYLGLNDTVLEIGITPNRPDAMSHIGIAREVGAILKKKLKLPAVKLKESKKGIKKFASVTVEGSNDCPRYTARVILGITVAPSPQWLQERLSAIGVRPVNNVVDVTNYVLMECGHPLHAFDYDTLNENSIIVKHAKAGEQFTTLDHKVRILSDDTLMICDGNRAVAIAGVMGGADTEISGTTRNILIESAYFSPQSIRRASKRFGLSTEASQRFERGADPEITVWAVNRAAAMIQEIAGGEVLGGCIDVYPEKIKKKNISLRPEKVCEILGININRKEIPLLLKRLDFTVTASSKKNSSSFSVTVPTFRPDIEREIDLIEEVTRMHGYDNIPAQNKATVHFSESAPAIELEDRLRSMLIGSGMNEIVANSMQQKDIALLGSSDIVEIINPISNDMAAMRTSLVPGLLSILRNNFFHQSTDLRLFEIGKVFFFRNGSYIEKSRVIMVISGNSNILSWDQKPRQVDIFDMKGEVEALLRKISLDKIKFIPYPTTNALTESGINVELQGERIGFLGLLRSDLSAKFEIDREVYFAELEIDSLSKIGTVVKKFKELPKYPSVARDIALIVDQSVAAGDIEKEIYDAGSLLLRSVRLFDLYAGDQIGEGKKSCAFALHFLSEDHTLVQDEIDNVMQNIIDRLAKKFNASIRK